MNILPLLIGFIIVFSYLSTSFLKEAQTITIIERSVAAAFRIETQLHNRLSLRQYLRKAHVKRSVEEKKEGKKRPYYSLRSITPPIDESKLNISALFNQSVIDVHQHPIYLVAAELIKLLYQGSPLISEKTQEHWERGVLDEMIAQAKKRSDWDQLSDLLPEGKEAHALFYKMVKGTNQYHLGTKKQGIAPLGHFISIDPDKKKQAIYFCFASSPLLTAAFGSTIANQLLLEEKKQWDKTGKRHLCSKEELEELLLKNAILPHSFTQLEPYLSFKRQLPCKTLIAGKDQITGLVITKDIRPLSK